VRRVARLLPLVCLAIACKATPDIAPEPSARPSSSAPPTASTGKVRLVDAPPEGDVEAAVHDAVAHAGTEKRRVVVYVGAKWCDPCQRFHHAAERGELDAAFPDVDFLTFDLDRDNERLASAGYVSKLIPLFALPGADGRASGQQVEGGMKGDSAVASIAPRLKGLLGR
jgi:thiol-disulfide isomerase/thioredoxin